MSMVFARAATIHRILSITKLIEYWY